MSLKFSVRLNTEVEKSISNKSHLGANNVTELDYWRPTKYNNIHIIPVIKISKDRACVDNILPFGGCEMAELARRANILLQRFCKLKVLLTLAACN